MDGRELLFWGAMALNGLAVLINVGCAWHFRRAERRLRELSLWVCMTEDEPEREP
jgi:hypothetical protein